MLLQHVMTSSTEKGGLYPLERLEILKVRGEKEKVS